jgi:hypothetical protein
MPTPVSIATATLAALFALAVSACDQQRPDEAPVTGPPSAPQIAEGGAVPAAPTPDGTADATEGVSGAFAIQPGLWRSTVTIEQMTVPGANRAETRAMNNVAPVTVEACNSNSDLIAFVQTGHQAKMQGCTLHERVVEGSRLRATVICRDAAQGSTTIRSQGSFTPTTLDMESVIQSTGTESGMEMRSNIVARRVGDCPA